MSPKSQNVNFRNVKARDIKLDQTMNETELMPAPVAIQPSAPMSTPVAQPSLPMKIAKWVFVELPRIIGRFVLDLFGRGKDSADSTHIVFGYVLLIIAGLVVWGIIDLDSLRNWFTGWWRFFFPVK
jgi:hypothetical protein